jgi:hypothetical protein
MKSAAVAAALAVLSVPFLSEPAEAAGCLKGALVGGVAGHYVGHHGWLGAGIGCLVGRHRANARARQEMNRTTTAGYGSSTYNRTTTAGYGAGYGSSTYNRTNTPGYGSSAYNTYYRPVR